MKGGNTSEANVLGRNFRKYCERTGVKFTPYQIRHLIYYRNTLITVNLLYLYSALSMGSG